MRTGILTWLCCAFFSQVFAEGENEVKRGVFPFMAFVYYSDESVVDGTGGRYIRGAVLIRPDWLVTSAVGPSVTDNSPNGFPQKTMLARLGAVAIDSNFTLNEDEDEQEREIIQIVRPFNNSATQWWRTDISLMKTLLPFNITTAVGPTSLEFKLDYPEKTCSILVYARKSESVLEDKVLMQLMVDMLPPSIETCGSHFTGSTMACAADVDDNKGISHDVDYCRGNSGGPLICDGQLIGLQTYIENSCKPPHLYQLVSVWENFIDCGIQNSCHEERCANTCDIVNKDIPVTESPKSDNASFVFVQTADSSVATSQVQEVVTEEGEIVLTPTISTLSTGQADIGSSDLPLTSNNIISSVETTLHTEEDDIVTTLSWPNEKHKEQQVNLTDESGELDRKTNVEAQYQQVDFVPPKVQSAANRNVCFIEIFVELFVLACLI